MKKLTSLLLVFAIIFSFFSGLDFSVFAEEDSEQELIDIDIYKAKVYSGIADDPNSNVVDRCYEIYSAYFYDEVFSPTQAFLDNCYDNPDFMQSYAEWQLYTLPTNPSVALDYVMKKEDYYESLIVSMYTEALKDSDFKKFVDNKILNDSVSLLNNVNKIIEVSQNVKPGNDTAIDLLDPETFRFIKKGIEDSKFGSASKAVGVLGDVLGYCKDLADVCQRISLYNTMYDLDDSVKNWLIQMCESCDENTDPALKAALVDLKSASTGFAESALVKIKDTSFSVAATLTEALIDKGISAFASLNPITAALVVGLQAGKTICNVFFATDDVCEQLYLMECMYDLISLSRNTTNKCKDTFVANQSLENAKAFDFSIDCHFELITNIDTDCMIRFLDNLYNGGIFKGLIRWHHGASSGDYQEAVDVLESLSTVRQDNYSFMLSCYLCALELYYPDTFRFYYGGDDNQVIPVTGISFSKYTTLPPGYPSGYADIIVGSYQNIDVQYTPSNTTQRLYTATSDNPQIIKIDNNVMFALSAGTANVTITSVDNPNVSYTAEIKVGEKKEDDESSQGITNRFNYTVTDGKATITGLVSGYSPTKLTIPSKIQGYPVTSIGYAAFEDCDSLTSITIPDSVTSIGGYAFHECRSLTSVTIPDSVTSIGDYAFAYCDSLTNVYYDGSNADWNKISIGSGNSYLTSNLNCKYYAGTCGNNLTWTLIPETGVLEITGTGAMTNWSSNSSVPWYSYRSYIKNVIIADSVTSIGDYAFRDCDSLTSITIPDSVTSIGIEAFAWCDSLTSVTIGNGVTSIGVEAFEYCDSLTSITIGNSVTSIGYSAFYSCDSLTDVYITDIAVWCNIDFYDSSANPIGYAENLYLNGKLVEALVIPDSVTSIGDRAFAYYRSLTSITIPDSVTSIGEWAFYDCRSLTSVTIPDSVTSIASYAFASCDSITSITIGNSVTSIGNAAFEFCYSLTDVYITDIAAWCNIGFDRIDANPMYYAENLYLNGELVGNIVIPGTVTSIGDYAFYACRSLTSVTIPDSVTSIGDDAFYACRSLTDVYITDIAVWCNIDFDSSDANPMYYVENLYLNGELVENLVIPDSVTSIGNYAFEGCKSLTSVTIPDSVTSIGNYAFRDCDSLTSITIGNSVTSIGYSAFARCDSLTSITVDSDNEYYSNDSYGVLFNKDKTVLIQYPAGNTRTSYVIPDSVTSIGNYAFYDCDSLTSVTIPDSVTSIGDYAFRYCSGIQHVLYKGSEEEWEQINIGSSNSSLTDATRHHNTTGDEIQIVTTDPTCTERGYYTLSCSICDWKYSTNYVDELGHNYEKVETVAPTCYSMGYDVYKCSRCDDEYQENFVDALGHNYEDGICTLCGKEKDPSIKIGDSLKVNIESSGDFALFSFVPETSGTYYFYSHSNVDTYGYIYDGNMDYLHSNDDGAGEGGNFLCSYYFEAGETYYLGARFYDSDYMGEFYVRLATEFTAVHNYEVLEKVDPTCADEGYETLVCSFCDYEKTNWIDSLDHDKSEHITTVNPTCEDYGYEIYHCSRCDEDFETNWVEDLGHIESELISTVQPTCEVYGYEIYHCSRCDEDFETNWIEYLGHEESELISTVEPTCEDYGYDIYHCSRCDKDFDTNWVEYLGHNYSDPVTVDPTCLNRGCDVYKCTRCDCLYHDNYTDAEEHNFVDGVCSGCNMHEDEIIQSEHNYSDYCDQTWLIEKTGANRIDVTFSIDTITESSYDFIYIYDAEENTVGMYSGYELAGKTITVNSDVVKIVLESDGSVNYYGFVVANITAYYPEADIFVPEGSSTVIDKEKNLISGLESGLDFDSFINCIAVSDDITIEADRETIGTGTKIKVLDKATSEVIEEYTAVIFGDYNGDGVADLEDTAYFASIANFEIFDYYDYDYLFMAADINGDGVVDSMDEEDMYAIANYEAYIDHTITSGSKVVRY